MRTLQGVGDGCVVIAVGGRYVNRPFGYTTDKGTQCIGMGSCHMEKPCMAS